MNGVKNKTSDKPSKSHKKKEGHGWVIRTPQQEERLYAPSDTQEGGGSS